MRDMLGPATPIFIRASGHGHHTNATSHCSLGYIIPAGLPRPPGETHSVPDYSFLIAYRALCSAPLLPSKYSVPRQRVARDSRPLPTAQVAAKHCRPARVQWFTTALASSRHECSNSQHVRFGEFSRRGHPHLLTRLAPPDRDSTSTPRHHLDPSQTAVAAWGQTRAYSDSTCTQQHPEPGACRRVGAMQNNAADGANQHQGQ